MHTKVTNPYILYTIYIIPNNVIGGQASGVARVTGARGQS